MSLPNEQIIFPLKLGTLDHYTLIVENAEKVSNFHIQNLGFSLIKIKNINTGTVCDTDYDMINYILELPQKDGTSCVVTEGLNDQTVFRQFLKKYGPGIHHVAYQIENIDQVFEQFKQTGIQTTSSTVIQDPVTGLKQFFIDRSYLGYFMELIERNTEILPSEFTESNMKKLANSVKSYI